MCNDKDDDNDNDEGLTKIQMKMMVLMMMISTTVTIWPKVTNQIILIVLNPFYSCSTAGSVFLGSVFCVRMKLNCGNKIFDYHGCAMVT